MVQSLRTLVLGAGGLLVLAAFLVACDSAPGGSGAETEEPLPPLDASVPILDDVTYVNKLLHASLVTGAEDGEYLHGMDLTLTFNGSVQRDALRRIRIWSSFGVGWDLRAGDLDALAYEDSTISMPNLIFTNGPTGDLPFDVSLYYASGDTLQADFVHNGAFPSPIAVASDGWSSLTSLRVTFGPGTGFWPDNPTTPLFGAGKISWRDGGTDLGTSAVSGFTGGTTVEVRDVPQTATAYTARLPGYNGNVKTEVQTPVRILPPRLPDETQVIAGIDVDRTTLTIETHEDRFFVLDRSDDSLFVLSRNGTIVANHQTRRGREPVMAPLSASEVAVGYEDGVLERVDLVDGTATRLLGPDNTVRHRKLLGLGDYILSGLESGSYDYDIQVYDAADGRLMSTLSQAYLPGDLVYSAGTGRIYMDNASSFPNNLSSFHIDLATGTVSGIRGSRYHGDHAVRSPLFVRPDANEIVTASGTIFSISSTGENDMVYAGSIAYSAADAIFRPSEAKMIVLRGRERSSWPPDHTLPSPYLDVYDTNTNELARVIDLPAPPIRMIDDGDSLYVLAFGGSESGRLFLLSYSNEDLTTTPAVAQTYFFQTRR